MKLLICFTKNRLCSCVHVLEGFCPVKIHQLNTPSHTSIKYRRVLACTLESRYGVPMLATRVCLVVLRVLGSVVSRRPQFYHSIHPTRHDARRVWHKCGLNHLVGMLLPQSRQTLLFHVHCADRAIERACRWDPPHHSVRTVRLL